MKRCPTCKEWTFSISHKCKPQWLVLEEEHHGSLTDWDLATMVREFSAEEAATKYTERRDAEDCDYFVAGGESIVIRVKPNFETSEPVKEFIVRGEWVTAYTAEEVKPQPWIGNFHMSIDPSIPQNEIHMKDAEGRVVSRIVGIGEPL